MSDPDEHYNEALANDYGPYSDEYPDPDCYEGPSDLFDD